LVFGFFKFYLCLFFFGVFPLIIWYCIGDGCCFMFIVKCLSMIFLFSTLYNNILRTLLKKMLFATKFWSQTTFAIKIILVTNDKLWTKLVANDRWNIFFVQYEYNNFIHVFKDEFMWLHLQLHLWLQCKPIVCSHVSA
jgi:hypothetical protein